LKLSPTGTGVFSHSGNLVICFCLPFGPTIAVRSSNASSGFNAVSPFAPFDTKSEKEGPAFNLSLNVVLCRFTGDSRLVGFVDAVAKQREKGEDAKSKDFDEVFKGAA